MTRRLPSAILARLAAVCEVDVPGGNGGISPGELRARVVGKQALLCVLTDQIDAPVIDAGGDLRVIANVAVGYDNIDVTRARARGIVVTNTPDVLTEAVAECTWGLILAVTRRLCEGDRLVRRGGWKGWALDFMLGAELRGKQLGILGAGRIGRAVGARAPAFGMRVVYTVGRTGPGVSTGDNRLAGSAGEGRKQTSVVAEGAPVSRVTLDELLVTSDVVCIHVPLTPETHHLIDRRALARMKRSAFLINTARGPIVDEAALAWALGERLIAGAALDVYEHEPAVLPELLVLENVVLAPHLGSATRETRTAMADLAASNVLAVLAGGQPLTPVG